MNIDLPWMIEAAKHVGLKEIPGKEHAPVIQQWLRELRAWWADDETPWCGVFVAHCCKTAKLPLPSAWYRAKAWSGWGTPLSAPAVGCVVVFERAGGGHVGFVMGKDKLGRLMVLGGNQGNAVSIAPFDRTRVIAYRWPDGYPFTASALPLLDTHAASSRNEA